MTRKIPPPPPVRKITSAPPPGKAKQPPEDDDEDTNDDDPPEDDDDDEGDDDDDDDKAPDGRKYPSKQSVNRAHRDAAKYRVRLKEANAQLDSTRAERDVATARLAFERAGRDVFEDTDVAWKQVDFDLLGVEDDGTVTGVDEAVEALADVHPFLLRRGSDDDKAKDDKNPFRAGRSGRPVTGRKAPVVPNRQSLAKKYPALRGKL